LSGKLLNYAREISTKLNPTTFKMLVSGEPIEARMIYGKPFLLTDYARFMFNTNVLPKDIEHNPGFFRRFIIIVFDQTISEEEKDTGLAEYIIKNELPGVFNWVLDGLNRLLSQGDFTKCLLITNAVEDFKSTSDSVNLFLDDGGYDRSAEDTLSLKSLYSLYAEYCKDSGYTACSLKSFSERLKNYGYEIIRKSSGRYVYIKKHSHY
jgi:putative DNA primase/helicase